MRPTLFIGSATESLHVARAIQEELEHDAEVTVWTQGVFNPSRTALDDLLASVSRFDFAIFVFAPHDILHIRNVESPAVRDNLLFELGLFIGRIGRERVFFLTPHDAALHIPTDLVGIAPLTYLPARKDGNVRAAVGSACNKVRGVLQTHDQLPMGPGTRRAVAPRPRADRGISPREQAAVQRVIAGVAKRSVPQSSLLLVADLDGFTGIGKWHGKDVADAVTEAVGEIVAYIAGNQYWARLGGDQFLICLSRVEPPVALDVASQLVDRIARHNWSAIVPNLFVRASVGIAPCKANEVAEHWIIRAINGATLAKKAGGNRVHLAPIALSRNISLSLHDHVS